MLVHIDAINSLESTLFPFRAHENGIWSLCSVNIECQYNSPGDLEGCVQYHSFHFYMKSTHV